MPDLAFGIPDSEFVPPPFVHKPPISMMVSVNPSMGRERVDAYFARLSDAEFAREQRNVCEAGEIRYQVQ
ncbi:hypothetical protein RSOLAG1IB_08895 [Rhizoctonia solani AG-1 IB]|uniref:Uncharacterized protein n=1 Tax=Thanatephorus cucumeris (strain AG1-IB / isolate 7/3/14) TaxID=1108050 RepID=A0A0B7FME0_THACB|nr:hypothetical protein RSOLAG1IB_08895 [Rhizoctonia solani AG-1 IB]